MIDYSCTGCGGKIEIADTDEGPGYLLRCSRCGSIVPERLPDDDRGVRHIDLVDLMTDTRTDYEQSRSGMTLAEIDAYTRMCLTKKCSGKYKSVV